MDLPALIADAVRNGDFLVSTHAARRLRSRAVELWQIEAGVGTWTVEEVQPDDLPNPSIFCTQWLVDGSEVKTVWAWYPEGQAALLVTVFFPERT